MLSLRIALRYLFSRKSHNAVNIISIISIAGVAVATMAIVCVLSVFNGFKEIASGRLSLINPELKAIPERGKVIAGADSLARIVTDMEDVALAVPTLSEQALAIFRGSQLPVVLKGVSERYGEVVAIDSTMIDGEFMLKDPYGYPTGALSVGAAITLGARPNPYEPVALFAPRRVGRINPTSPIGAFRTDSVLVSGVWQIEQADIDEAGAIVSIETARDLFDYTDNEASAIEIALHPGTDTGTAKKEIAGRLKGWKILDRQEQQESSFRMISIEKWITFLMLAFILVIASFNVVSTLSM
ncbi:MAG: ABC transporter permease, partial [Paramuribaculum sp.]|nr:ABC transporter permease [Paramuribaculum sp.]